MISKAIIPLAGLGTRMKPITNIVPKELLPILNTPALEIIFNELQETNINEYLFITNKNKVLLNNYIKNELNKRNSIKVTFIYQQIPKGLGHAIKLCEKYIDKNEYFLLVLPDNIFSPYSISNELINLFNIIKKPLVSINIISKNEFHKRAIVFFSDKINKTKITKIIDKPNNLELDKAYAISGRYLLNNDIFDLIDDTVEKGKEIEFTKALSKYCDIVELQSYKHKSIKYDIGSIEGYYEAFMSIGKEKLDRTLYIRNGG